MFRIAVLLAVAVASLQAQSPFFDYLPQVRQYLTLSDAQLQSIQQNNNEHNTWLLEKARRVAQVQMEIEQEKAKTTIDPMALGLRYLEIEGICRQIAEKAVEYRTKNVAVLEPAQRTKLKTLEDALALVPVIMEAQQVKLLGEPMVFTGSTSLVVSPIVNSGDSFSRTDGVRLGVGTQACTVVYNARNTIQP